MIELNSKYISLPFWKTIKLKLKFPTNVKWYNDNPIFNMSENNGSVNSEAMVSVFKDYHNPRSQGIVTIKQHHIGGITYEDNAEITVVGWEAGESKIEKIQVLPFYGAMRFHENKIYFASGLELFYTDDSFLSSIKISDLPIQADKHPLQITPQGYFYLGIDKKIYMSRDLSNWEIIGDNVVPALYHAFCSVYDEIADTTYIFSGQYTSDSNTVDTRHKVFKATVTDNSVNWETAIEFYSYNEYLDQSLTPSAHHVHVVNVDPYTNSIWVNVGDVDSVNAWYCSNDYGQTFTKIGGGSPDWRSLSIWFTEKYIYWNTDSGSPQSIWRLDRNNLNVQSQEDDYKEHVALLDNGSHWYSCWANDILIMGQSCEGEIRDERLRVFGIQERQNGLVVDIQELFTTKGTGNTFAQLEPVLMDNNDYLYFRTRSVEPSGIWKCTLNWKKINTYRNWRKFTQ